MDYTKKFFLREKQKKFRFIMLCRHRFVKDLIDIDVEKSITIVYCTKCELIIT